jgi:hypothetical protein
MKSITINRHGQGYISHCLAKKIIALKIKLVPIDRYNFIIVFDHKKLNTVYHNKRGTYVYCSKKLVPGKYIVNDRYEGRNSIG